MKRGEGNTKKFSVAKLVFVCKLAALNFAVVCRSNNIGRLKKWIYITKFNFSTSVVIVLDWVIMLCATFVRKKL